MSETHCKTELKIHLWLGISVNHMVFKSTVVWSVPKVFYLQLRTSKQMGSDEISDFFVFFNQIMPIARPLGHSGIPSQMPSRSTVSGSGQPGKLRGWGCSWRQSQDCSGIKQNMPLSGRASQHLAPAAGEQINIIVSTELHFCVCVKVYVSPTCFAKLCSPWACSSALPLLLFARLNAAALPCQWFQFHFLWETSYAWSFCSFFFSWRKENNNSKLNLRVLRKFLWLKPCEQRCPGRTPQSPEYPGSSAKGWYITS